MEDTKVTSKRNHLTAPTGAYNKPFVPQGFTYLTGNWDSGFVIADSFGNEFVWVPVGNLDKNGTLDGITFNSSFGLRNWYNYDFSLNGWHEFVPEHIVNSVLKAGGFYVARYTASLENEEIVFKKGNLPLIEMTYEEAVHFESTFKTDDKELEHCLMLGSAYDSICQWFIQSGVLSGNEVLDDSSYLGNYANNEKYYLKDSEVRLLPTGSNEDWKIFNIYDLAGNTAEFTQERHSNDRIVMRSGNYRVVGRYWPIADRYFREPLTRKVNLSSFRTILFQKTV